MRTLARGLAAAALAAAPAAADVVTTTDGGLYEVASYEVEGDWARLFFEERGAILLPLAKIERIVATGPEPAAEEAPAPLAVALDFPAAAPVPATPYGRLIWETARRHGVNPALVAAVVAVESDFELEAVSHKGARGLMQLMPATARRFGVAPERLFEPAANLEAGVRYLAWLARRYPGDPTRVLAAYNAGELAVDRHGGVPPYGETREYLRRLGRRLAAS